MQCPKCNYDGPAEEFGNPAQCPACGVFIHKVVGSTPPPVRPEPAAEPVDEPSIRQQLSMRVQNARDAAEQNRKRREAAEEIAARPPAAQPVSRVIVTDFQIPFWSLVQLLVKFALAAIPAAVILVILVWGAASIISLL